VLAAWTNHNDIRNLNNLDVYVTDDDGRSYLKHYLIDFGATLGSASLFPNLLSEGYEYIVDFGAIGKSAVTLGIHRRAWEGITVDDMPSIGHFGAAIFEPAEWKPNYPNPAFRNLTDRDGYWGAKIVMAFTDEIVGRIVDEARYSDPAAAQLMKRLLIIRRNAIGRHWFDRVNPLDRFRLLDESGQTAPAPSRSVTAGQLEFEDLAVTGQLSPATGSLYRYRIRQRQEDGAARRSDWRETDGCWGAISQAELRSGVRRLPLDGVRGDDGPPLLVEVEIQTRRPDRDDWSRSTIVELARGRTIAITGIRR
jgi:hypothetical protein